MIKHNHNFDLKEEIRAYWSQRAESFDEEPTHRIEDQFGKPEWQSFIRQAFGLNDITDLSQLHALDLACGTGEISRMLCGIGLQVTGLDFSEAMHAIAKAKLLNDNWQPLLCDAENLVGVENESFDFLITRHLAWTLTDPAKAFEEWYRVLKPGGRLLIVDGNWSQPPSITLIVKRWLAQFIARPKIRSIEDRAQNAAIRKRLPYADGLTLQELQQQLSVPGFKFVTQPNIAPLYKKAMRGWPLGIRLRQSSENRFALVVEK